MVRLFSVIIILAALGVFAFYSVNFYADNAPDNPRPIKIDPFDKVPEWIILQVEKALPDSLEGMVWFPGEDFQNSSLIKVPRFPRPVTGYDLQVNGRLRNQKIVPIKETDTLEIQVMRNEVFSGQLVFISKKEIKSLEATSSSLISTRGFEIPGGNVKLRYVGYVPVKRAGSEYDWSAKYEDVVETGFSVSGTMNPDIVADPLYDLDYLSVPAYRNQPVWVSIYIPSDTETGLYAGGITINTQTRSFHIPLKLEVLPQSIPDPDNFRFFTDLWMNPNSISGFHGIENWSEEHWILIERYMRVLASLGTKSITTTIVNEPWQIPWTGGRMKPQTFTGYESMVRWVLKGDGSWHFDYNIFDRYVETGLRCGLTDRINVYSLTAFRGKERIRYFGEQDDQTKEMIFDSPEDLRYEKVWKIFLEDFYDHLSNRGWENKTYLSFDEQPDSTMKSISGFIKKQVPGFSDRISISGHPESNLFATGFLSISYEFFPDQNLSSEETLSVIKMRNDQDRTTTFYLCGQPAHPNSFTFSPIIESRMIPWLALKYNMDGYLRWSFNNWTNDPIKDPVYNFIQGDEYLVYPGPNGPLSSIRFEVLRDGIEDFELFAKYQSELSARERIMIIDLATRNQDGRLKNIEDIDLARKNILNSIPGSGE